MTEPIKAVRYHYIQNNPKAPKGEQLVGWDSLQARWTILEVDAEGNLQEKQPVEADPPAQPTLTTI
jgi:hypothetical protein